jgi:hypothetical protein
MRKILKSNIKKVNIFTLNNKQFSQKISFHSTAEVLDHISTERNKNFETGLNKLKKEIYVTNTEEKNLLSLTDLNNLDWSILEETKLLKNEVLKSYSYYKLMKLIVTKPELISNFLTPEQINYNNLITFLQESSLKKEFVRNQVSNEAITEYTYNKIKILLKYLIMLLDNYEESLKDKEMLVIINGILKYAAEEKFNNLLNNLEFLYFLTRICDKMESSEGVLNIKKYLKNTKLTREFENTKLLNLIFTTYDNTNKNELFFRLVFVLAKVQNEKTVTTLWTNSKVKSNLIEYLDNLDLTKDKFFRNNDERTIIFYLCLHKLRLLKRICKNINFEYFSLGSFHIIYTLIFKNTLYENNLNLSSIEEILKNIRTRIELSELISFREVFLMKNTIDWYIKSFFKSINYYNCKNLLQFNSTRRISDLFSVIVSQAKISRDPNERIYIAYFLSKYFSDPEEDFKVLCQQSINISNLNFELLNKFLDSVLQRFDYVVKYEHEVYILNKMKKNIYIPYNNKMDVLIVDLAKQFLNKVKNNEVIDSHLLSSGLKLIKIIFKVDEVNINYNISEELISLFKHAFENTLHKNSNYIRILKFGDFENLILLFPYVEFYHRDLSELFHNFILFSIKNYYADSRKIKIVDAICKYFVFSPNNNIKIIKLRNEICSYISQQLSKIFKTSTIKLNILSFDETQYSFMLPSLILNLYNVFSMNRDKYADQLALLENHIKSNKGLRALQGYYLMAIKKELLSESTLLQILSNLQTIQPLKNKKQNLVCSILTEDNVKEYVDKIIESLITILPNSTSFSNFNFSSLSYLISTIIDKFNDEEIIGIFKIFGNKKIENYHPSFIRAILSRFSDREMLFGLLKKKENDFFNLAFNWPLFVKNDELLRAITYCHISKLLQFKRYEIISLITYNRINYTKLLEFFGKAISKIKIPTLKKKVLCDYIKNCSYVGYQLQPLDYEEILILYSELSKTIPFKTQELNDLLVLGIISNFIDSKKSSKNSRDIYNSIIDSVTKAHTLKLEIENEEGKKVSYYPSISSEERCFQKSLSINTGIDLTVVVSEETQEKPVSQEESPNYLRKVGEGFSTVDEEFENYLMKKKEVMYKHQAYLNDNFESIEILKKWLISKYFEFDLQDEHLEIQLEQIINRYKNQIRAKLPYENFYLSLLSFVMQKHMKIDSDYKDPNTSMIIDYRILNMGKSYYIIIVPEQFCSTNIQENNSIHPDGTYLLFFECLKKNKEIKLIHLLEPELSNYAADFNSLFTN